jgi:4-amino-4-deoxy-L-arabinose transferase-like glycosyltransferase
MSALIGFILGCVLSLPWLLVAWCAGYDRAVRERRQHDAPWTARSISFGTFDTYTTSVADSGYITERTR